MSIEIVFLDGPLKDQPFVFPDNVVTIEIGRAGDQMRQDADHKAIVFPPDYTKIGSRHVTIQQVGGRYKLETNGRNFVQIDGQDPHGDDSLENVRELTLGADRIRMRIKTSTSGSLPVTDLGPTQLNPRQRAQRQRRIIGAIAAVLVLIVAGLGWMYRDTRANADALKDAQIAMSNLGKAAVSPEVIEKAKKSVYLVLVADAAGKESPVGTAWAYDAGHLATNAHVAAAFNDVPAGSKLIARSTVAPYATVQIESIAMHPDYTAFTKEWDAKLPGRVQTQNVEFMQSPGAGYDVALMAVVPGSKLAEPLPVADLSELTTLKAGMPVAYAGFPMELLASGGVNPKQPVPQAQVGNITAVSDYFLLPAEDAERHLIQHSLSVTGGASGSPMIDAEGRVVGLVSGMNLVMVQTGRAPSAAGVNFAQRADLLKELVDVPNAAATETRRVAWQAGFDTFDKPEDTIPTQLLRQWKTQLSTTENPQAMPAKTADLIKVENQGEGDGSYYVAFNDLFTEPGHYLILAISKTRKDIDLAVVTAGQKVAENTGYDWYPSVVLENPATSGTQVVVYFQPNEQSGQLDPSKDTSITLQVWRLP